MVWSAKERCPTEGGKRNRRVTNGLNNRQHFPHLEFCSSLLLQKKNDPFCVQKWIHYSNKKRSGQWLVQCDQSVTIVTVRCHPLQLFYSRNVLSGNRWNALTGQRPIPRFTDHHYLKSERIEDRSFISFINVFKHLDNFLIKVSFTNQEQTKTAFDNFNESAALDFYRFTLEYILYCIMN